MLIIPSRVHVCGHSVWASAKTFAFYITSPSTQTESIVVLKCMSVCQKSGLKTGNSIAAFLAHAGSRGTTKTGTGTVWDKQTMWLLYAAADQRTHSTAHILRASLSSTWARKKIRIFLFCVWNSANPENDQNCSDPSKDTAAPQRANQLMTCNHRWLLPQDKDTEPENSKLTVIAIAFARNFRPNLNCPHQISLLTKYLMFLEMCRPHT